MTKLEPFSISSLDGTERHDVPAGVCLLGYRGSTTHGTRLPTSRDIDLIGVALAEKNVYLGLGSWGSRGTCEIVQGPYDAVYYEIKKAFSLFLRGNPSALELLWIDPKDYVYRSEAGHRIVAGRDLFVGKHVYAAFAGYASQQLAKMETRDAAELRYYMAVTNEAKIRCIHPTYNEDASTPGSTGEERDVACWSNDRILRELSTYAKKGENLGRLGEKRKELILEHGYDTKNAAHCVRLLRMGIEYLKTGVMLVNRSGIDADELKSIKLGQWGLEKVKAEAEALFAETKSALAASTLPEQPDEAGAEKLLVEILEESLR